MSKNFSIPTYVSTADTNGLRSISSNTKKADPQGFSGQTLRQRVTGIVIHRGYYENWVRIERGLRFTEISCYPSPFLFTHFNIAKSLPDHDTVVSVSVDLTCLSVRILENMISL